MTKQKNRKFCTHCGKVIKSTDRFCSSCGNTQSKAMRSIKTKRPNLQQNWVWITGLVVAIAFIITIVMAGRNTAGQKSVNRAHNTAQIASIAAEFDCSCGTCDKTLADCDCPTAKDTYAFIRKKVGNETSSRLQVIKMVNDRYGHLINKSILEG